MEKIIICFVPEDMREVQIIECIKQRDFSNMFYLGKSEEIDLIIEASNSNSILDNPCISEFPARIKDICSYEDLAIKYEKDIIQKLDRQQIYNELKGVENIIIAEVIEQSQFYDSGDIILITMRGDLGDITKNKVYNLTLSADSYFEFFSPSAYLIFEDDKVDLAYCELAYNK